MVWECSTVNDRPSTALSKALGGDHVRLDATG
jgi:hypothetical protein